MDIYNSLRQDHERVRDLMARITECGDEDSPARQRLFEQMKKELLLHSKAEEKAFYDPLQQSGETRSKVEHGFEEHREAEQMLGELSDESLAGAAWTQKFLKLKETFEHHVKEEENEIFPAAEQVLDDNQEEEMAQWMRSGKEELRGSIRL